MCSSIDIEMLVLISSLFDLMFCMNVVSVVLKVGMSRLFVMMCVMIFYMVISMSVMMLW